jgi:hypothetical protein
VQLPTQPGEPLNARAESPSRGVHTHTPALDLGIAKASLALHAVSLALIAVSKNGGLFFAASMLATLGTGYAPVVQSLSLELYVRRGGEMSESGRLFGAMSVIQALGCVRPLFETQIIIKQYLLRFVQDPDHRPVAVRHRLYQDGRYVPSGNVLRLYGSRFALPLLALPHTDTAGIERKDERRRGGGSGSPGGCRLFVIVVDDVKLSRKPIP